MQQFCPRHLPMQMHQPLFASPAPSPLNFSSNTVVDFLKEARGRLNARLKSDDASAGFPFAVGSGGKQGRFEFYEYLPCKCQGLLSCRHGDRKMAARITYEPPRTTGSSKYYHWTASFPGVNSPSCKASCNLKRTVDLPLAHVRVDPRVMGTHYGTYITNNVQVILSALAASVELGMMVTITLDDRSGNVIFLGRANDEGNTVLLHRVVPQHRW
ncbi:hypothetical protein C8F01DRAFT_481976 [Mycena amicta]|nr:hypothetical protein C8F01DRAFT_481976 [Mycena amicta]